MEALLRESGIVARLQARIATGREEEREAKRLCFFMADDRSSMEESTTVKSLEPAADTIARYLRGLKPTGYRDALFLRPQAAGGPPEVLLRVDLTPEDKILKAWARWGDRDALAETLDRALAPLGVEGALVLKESTLHLFVSKIPGKRASDAPVLWSEDEQQAIARTVAPLLQILAPINAYAAAIYGMGKKTTDAIDTEASPVWVDWIEISTLLNPRQTSAVRMAERGNLEALAFLLERLVNPDLEEKLATGGIRVLVRCVAGRLHVVCEAPTCPERDRVAPKLVKFARKIGAKDISGIRIYGRRAGLRSYQWQVGANFPPPAKVAPTALPLADADRLEALAKADVPQPVAATEAVSAARPERRSWGPRQWLFATQIFIPATDAPPAPVRYGAITAMVWLCLGALLTVSADWYLAERADDRPNDVPPTESALSSISAPLPDRNAESPAVPSFDRPPDVPRDRGDLFSETRTARDYPSFTVRQIDEKLALYEDYLRSFGPPDVLIVGSSRALRGIEPLVLEAIVAERGYKGARVFNFGINGATAQVADVLVREILAPQQLPKAIVWADGARALNSGRTDITYNAIAVSEGYRKLAESGIYPIDTHAIAPEADAGDGEEPTTVSGGSVFSLFSAEPAAAIADRLESWETSLQQNIARLSAAYPHRQQLQRDLQAALQHGETEEVEAPPESEFTFAGFLPVELRFDPIVYYEERTAVAGKYDADYKSFRLYGKQNAAARALLDFTNARGIEVVFVNMPLTQEYLDTARAAYERQFRQHMIALSLERGFVFRDLSQLWTAEYQYFSDPSHLNVWGASELARRLARDPAISWGETIRSD